MIGFKVEVCFLLFIGKLSILNLKCGRKYTQKTLETFFLSFLSLLFFVPALFCPWYFFAPVLFLSLFFHPCSFLSLLFFSFSFLSLLFFRPGATDFLFVGLGERWCMICRCIEERQEFLQGLAGVQEDQDRLHNYLQGVETMLKEMEHSQDLDNVQLQDQTRRILVRFS